MKTLPTLSFFLVFTLFFSMSIHLAYADDNSIDLSTFPQQLADALNVSLFGGQMLATSILMVMFMLPIAIWTKTIVPPLFVGFVVMGAAIGIGWLDYWFLIVFCVGIAALLAGTMRNFLTGKGE